MRKMATDIDAIKDIVGYKKILKTVLKSQIQLLVEQLAASTDEESVILSANIADGTLSHLGSESGKVFLQDHEDIKSQFLRFCLKRHHNKRTIDRFLTGRCSEEISQVIRNTQNQHTTSSPQKDRHKANHSQSKFITNRSDQKAAKARIQPVYLTKASKTTAPRNTGLRHAPYPVYPLQRVKTPSTGQCFGIDPEGNGFLLGTQSLNILAAEPPVVKLETDHMDYAESAFSQHGTSVGTVENQKDSVFSNYNVEKHLCDTRTGMDGPCIEVIDNNAIPMNVDVNLENVTVSETETTSEGYSTVFEPQKISNVSKEMDFGSKSSAGSQERTTSGDFGDSSIINTLDVRKTETLSRYCEVTELPSTSQQSDLSTESFEDHINKHSKYGAREFKFKVESVQSDKEAEGPFICKIKSEIVENDFIAESGNNSQGFFNQKSRSDQGLNLFCVDVSKGNTNLMTNVDKCQTSTEGYQKDTVFEIDTSVAHFEMSDADRTGNADTIPVPNDDKCSKDTYFSCDMCSRRFSFRCHLKSHECIYQEVTEGKPGFEGEEVPDETETRVDDIQVHRYIQQIQDTGFNDEEMCCFKKFIGEVIISPEGYHAITCKQCHKEFSKSRFVDHVFTHLKPYKCLKCGLGFRQRADRRTHLIKVHKVPVFRQANFHTDTEVVHFKTIFSHILSVLYRRLNKSDKKITIDFNQSPLTPSENASVLADSTSAIDSVGNSPFVITKIESLSLTESVMKQTLDYPGTRASGVMVKQQEQPPVTEEASRHVSDSPVELRLDDSLVTPEMRSIIDNYIDHIIYKEDGSQYMICKLCHKNFLGKRFLEHIFSHTKPYKCLKCGLGFRQRADRRAHLIKVHKVPISMHANVHHDTEAVHYKAIFSDILKLSVLKRRLNKLGKKISVDLNQSTQPSTASKRYSENVRSIAENTSLTKTDIDTTTEELNSSVGYSPFVISKTQSLASTESVTELTSDFAAAGISSVRITEEVERSTVKKEAAKFVSESPVELYLDSHFTPENRTVIDKFIAQIFYKEDGFQYVICKLCLKEFIGRRFLEHIFNHTKPYRCWTCGDGFRHKCDRRNHYIKFHKRFPELHLTRVPDDEAERFKSIFSNILSKKGPVNRKNDSLDTHEESVHRESELPLHLDITDMNDGNSAMNKSVSIPENTIVTRPKEEKQNYVTCKICGLCIRKSHMKEHRFVHSKPFRCMVCQYAAARKAALDLHMSVKHGFEEAN
ncbi:uncharacterized protein LOC123540622 [Mercenaria mercenaria]|uniref:uncharacterized protein LOC123540622 n=1 Tax=Mercenaria mercenaria TaxID=6596 RepID=UPI00234EE8FF|nr:uncharacterized protein LOC123540622 [Mercenaria mercenaria]